MENILFLIVCRKFIPRSKMVLKFCKLIKKNKLFAQCSGRIENVAYQQYTEEKLLKTYMYIPLSRCIYFILGTY